MPRRSFTAPAAALLVGALFACEGSGSTTTTDDDNFRADVLYCEEALAYLSSCCPAFDPTKVPCHYYFTQTTGCDNSSSYSETPALDQPQSECILSYRCDALVADKVCERAQAATAYTSSTGDGYTPPPPPLHLQVCP